MNIEEKVLAYHHKNLEKFLAKFKHCKVINTELTKKDLGNDLIQISVKTRIMMILQGGTQTFETVVNVQMGK